MNKLLRLSIACSILWGGLGVATPPTASAHGQSTRNSNTVTPKDKIEKAPESIDWLEINVETPGSLGVEILYKASTLSEVKALRVTGKLNETDGTTLSNLKAIEHLDLSGARLKAIPDGAFYATSLSSILLPEDIETIGSSAFAQTCLTEITLPASINTFGYQCFYGCGQLKEANVLSSADISDAMFMRCEALETVEISEGPSLIGADAFRYCYALSQIKLPKTLKTIGSYSFNDTYALSDIVLPSGLQEIQNGAFWGTALKKVEIPLYATFTGQDNFKHAKSLEAVVLPATFFHLDHFEVFYGCDSLKSVECPMPVPPTGGRGYNPFSGLDLSNMTLKVPDFAVVNYKLDSLWMRFGQIEGTATYNYIPIDDQLSFTNDRRPANPSTFNLLTGARLIIGGNAPLNMLGLDMTYYIYNNWDYGQIINSSPAVTSEKGTMTLSMNANVWYFLTLPGDVSLPEISHSENADFIVREYDGATRALEGTGNSWKDLPSDAVLKAGKGYILRTKQKGDLIIPFTAQSCAQILDNKNRILYPTAHNSERPEDTGWNLLGNPWPSYYDLAFSDITTTVQTYDTYRNTYQAYSLLDDHVVLHPGQAFFIQQPEDGTISLPTEGRCFTSEGMESAMRIKGTESSSRSLFDLSLSGNNSYDRTRIVINPEAKSGYEIGRDAAKFFPEDNSHSAMYSLDIDGNPLAINERPLSDGRVPLIFETSDTGKFTLTATRIDGELSILDSYTGDSIDLKDGESMEIELPGDGEACSRYLAVISSVQSTGVNGNIESSKSMRITSDNGTLIVEGAKGKVEIYSANGYLVASSYGDHTFMLTSGLYIVKSTDSNVKCIVK